jgi:hypothetical protein
VEFSLIRGTVIELDAVAVPAADCVLTNDKGSWRLPAPGDLQVSRSNKPMKIECRQAGMPPGQLSVESSTRAAMFGNILLGGVIGAGVDYANGAAFEYPGVAVVTMGRTASLDLFAVKGSGNASSLNPRTIPASTAFAAVDDVDKVPNGPAARARYREFLSRPLPRAFAASQDGQHVGVSYSWQGLEPGAPADPNLRAMDFCRRASKGAACRLYAVDSTVVWVAPTEADKLALSTVPSAIEPKLNRFAAPTDSKFANLSDVAAVPVRDDARGKYLQFLTLPMPRAFAVAADGSSRMASDSASAMADVLSACEREGKPCWLYAVDDRVVWRTDPAQRVSRASQLQAAPAVVPMPRAAQATE